MKLIVTKRIYLAFIFFTSIYLVLNYYSTPSLGSDETIFYTIPGKLIMQSSSFSELFNILTYGFFYEDHVNPVLNFFSPIINYAIDHEIPHFINLIFFFLALLIFFYLTKNITKSSDIGVYLTVLAASNIYLNWYLVTSNFSFLLSLIFQFLAILLVLKENDLKNSFLLLLICTLGSMTFENFFLCYFLICILWFFKVLNNTNNRISLIIQNTKKNIKVPIVLFISLIPYTYLHYQMFGSLLPSSRSEGGFIELTYQVFSVVYRQINEIFIGLPELFVLQTKNFISFKLQLFLIGLALIFCLIKTSKSLINKGYLPFLIGLLAFIGVIGFTGRYHQGLWALCWFVFVILLFPIFNNSKSNSKQFIFWCIPIVVLALSNHNFKNSDYMQGQKMIIDKSYLFDSALSHIATEVSYPEIYFDLSDNSVFHPIRVLLSNRSAFLMNPAEIINKNYGSQPVGSKISWFQNTSIKKNDIQAIQSTNQKYKFIFILNEHIITYENYQHKKIIFSYQWLNCEERISSAQLNNEELKNYSERDAVKMKQIAEALQINSNEILDLNSSKCLPKKYFKNNSSKKKSNYVSGIKIKTYDVPCRLQLNYGYEDLKTLLFLNSNHIEPINEYGIFPVRVQANSFDLNAKNRHENKLEFKTSDQLKEGLLKICNFNNELI
jgi:hypothetical protein